MTYPNSPPTIGGTTFRGPIRSGKYTGDPTTSTLGTVVLTTISRTITTSDTNVSAHFVVPNGASIMQIDADVDAIFEASAAVSLQFGYNGNVSALGVFGVSAAKHYTWTPAASGAAAWLAVSAPDTTPNNVCPILVQMIGTTTPGSGSATVRIMYNLGV